MDSIYRELLNSPKSSIISRKYPIKTESLLIKWLHKYCQSYHTLFKEFNYNNIKVIHHKKEKQSNNSKTLTLKDYL